jgi:hypothetical protein
MTILLLLIILFIIIIMITGHECRRGTVWGRKIGGKRRRILVGEQGQTMSHRYEESIMELTKLCLKGG